MRLEVTVDVRSEASGFAPQPRARGVDARLCASFDEAPGSPAPAFLLGLPLISFC
ncbi:hypothetical protein ACFQ3P_30335 [Paraburkholderia sabiae]|uniref:Uncharacterized protein n=1 Tax=Paraburkholderia sabiae TaxID=273251 RepID=A0ABU9QN32_9BURK|nr:hypothetical protein [Paraburkholderia sabiae]WJZ74933.1 hypothetical protein QEN71_03715 [Paraburkholderia sabiae]